MYCIDQLGGSSFGAALACEGRFGAAMQAFSQLVDQAGRSQNEAAVGSRGILLVIGFDDVVQLADGVGVQADDAVAERFHDDGVLQLEGEDQPEDIRIGHFRVVVKLVGKDQKPLIGLESPLDAVYGEGSIGHEIEHEHETVMRVAVETAALQLPRGFSGKQDDVARDANVLRRTSIEIVVRRPQLKCVLYERQSHSVESAKY